jgi:hypothetical protein
MQAAPVPATPGTVLALLAAMVASIGLARRRSSR